ncbi:MAG: 6-phosphofructokinase [Desulfobacterales bacterium]|nr:6-phosphofructokinase [Desulfobacterales bacterium]
MGKNKRRLAINVGAGFVPAINAVVKGAGLAASKLGWEITGIRDGFEGLLNPDHYPDGGLVNLSPQRIENLDPAAGSVIGQSSRVDPFNVRTINEHDMVEEVDMSDELLKRLKAENIDAVISIVSKKGLSLLHKLHLKGLNVVCVPLSVENDIASTAVSFGFNSTLDLTIEMLARARIAAQSARKIAVVEVLGEQTGWLALQSGIAVGADAILIPEIPMDLNNVADKLKEKMSLSRPYGLVVVAQGAKVIQKAKKEEDISPLKATLSPLATGESSSEYVIQRSGKTAEKVATELQLLIAEETYPLVVGPWARGANPSAVDRQLGIAYGAGAVQALKEGNDGVMVSFIPPEIKFIPLVDAINKIRTVSADNEYLKIADSIGICFGKEEK